MPPPDAAKRLLMTSGNVVRAGRWVFVASLLLIGFATLSPGKVSPAHLRPDVFCWACSANGGSDLTLNIALFVPFGIALGLLNLLPVRAGTAGLILSFAIESLQYFGFPVGRVANVSDLVANSVGSLVGGFIGAQWQMLLLPVMHKRRQAWVSIVFVIGLNSFCGWALRPYSAARKTAADGRESQPRKPFPTGYGWFHGQLTAVEMDGRFLMHTGDGPDSIASTHAAGVHGSATVLGRDERLDLVPFLYVYEPDHLPKVLVGQRGLDVQLRGTLNASRLRLGLPTLTLHDAFTERDAGPRNLRFVVNRQYWELSSKSAAPLQREILHISLGLSWTLFQTVVHVEDRLAFLVTILWSFGLWLPVGYWCTIAGVPEDADNRKFAKYQRWQFVAAGIAALLLTLSLVPRVTGIAATLSPEWILSAMGMAVGVFLATRFYRYIPPQ